MRFWLISLWTQMWERLLPPAVARWLGVPGWVEVYWWMQFAWVLRSIHLVAELGIADHLHQRPRSSAELAALVDVQPEPLDRVLRLLTSFGFFRVNRQGQFLLTRLSESLRSDVPYSSRWWAIRGGAEGWTSAAAAIDSLRNGRSCYENLYNSSMWDYLNQRPAARDNFILAMNSFTEYHVKILASAYPFGQFKRIVDVGGGSGALTIAILKQFPRLEGMVVDQPVTIEHARQCVEQAGLAQRCTLVAGSFFEDLPPHEDAYIIKHVLHDWNDECVTRILTSCRRAMRDDSQLLIINGILPDSPYAGRMLRMADVQMLVELGGGLRDLAGYERLCKAAGLRIESVRPTALPDGSIIVVRKIV